MNASFLPAAGAWLRPMRRPRMQGGVALCLCVHACGQRERERARERERERERECVNKCQESWERLLGGEREGTHEKGTHPQREMKAGWW